MADEKKNSKAKKPSVFARANIVGVFVWVLDLIFGGLVAAVIGMLAG